MKPKAIILTFLLLLLLALFSYWYIGRTADAALSMLADLRQGLETENWELVDSRIAVFEQKWEKIIPYWQMLIDHREIDSIEQSLVSMKEFVLVRDREHGLNELAVLEKIIEHIPKRELPLPGNIL